MSLTPKQWKRLAFLAVLPLVLVLGAVAESDGPGDALVFALLVAAFFALLLLPLLLTRRRQRALRRPMSPHEGVWRASGPPFELSDLLGGGRRLWWMRDRVWLDVTVKAEGLGLAPAGRVATWQGFRPATVPWEDVAQVSEGERRYTDEGGKFRLTGVTEVTFVLVGPSVDEFYRPMTDAEFAQEQMTPEERAEYDGENAQDAREEFGEDYVFGTWPLQLLFDDPEGLVEKANRWCRGAMPG